MNRPQVTTTGGAVGLGMTFQGILNALDGHTISQTLELLKGLDISDLTATIVGVALSIIAIIYDEDK